MSKIIILLLASLPLAAVAAQKTSCPLVLQKETVTVHAPAGWQGYSSSIMRLTGYGMMAGPPESMTYLVPADSKKQNGINKTAWSFEGGGEKWLYCTYDGSSAIQISRRLDDKTTRCEVSSKTGKMGSIEVADIECR